MINHFHQRGVVFELGVNEFNVDLVLSHQRTVVFE